MSHTAGQLPSSRAVRSVTCYSMHLHVHPLGPASAANGKHLEALDALALLEDGVDLGIQLCLLVAVLLKNCLLQVALLPQRPAQFITPSHTSPSTAASCLLPTRCRRCTLAAEV